MTDVHAVLNGELEAFLDEGPVEEGKGTADVYEAEVPAELGAAYIVAQGASVVAHRRLLEPT